MSSTKDFARKRYLQHYLLAALLMIGSHVEFAHAEQTAYVRDVLYVPVRSGAGNQFRIVHKGLKSNTILTILEENEDHSWVKIRTSNDMQGWVPKQFITLEKTANLKLTTVQAQLKKNQNINHKISAENNDLKAKLKKISHTAEQNTTEKNKLTLELQKIKRISSEAIELNDRYQTLLEKHELLKTQADTLSAENDRLKSDQHMTFMLYGAGLIILGMLLNVLIPRLKRQRRFSEW